MTHSPFKLVTKVLSIPEARHQALHVHLEALLGHADQVFINETALKTC